MSSLDSASRTRALAPFDSWPTVSHLCVLLQAGETTASSTVRAMYGDSEPLLPQATPSPIPDPIPRDKGSQKHRPNSLKQQGEGGLGKTGKGRGALLN